VEALGRMLQSSSANGRIQPPDLSEAASSAARVMRVALVGSSHACARLRSEVEGTFAIVGTFRDLASARAGTVEADAFLIANEGAGSRDPAYTDPAYVEPLTEREIEVLELLAEGLSNKGIAARLGISDQTVKFHVASISGKLGTHTRTETVRRAVRTGLISL
jgi:DNA-binding CsgD family transcriptional regulator